MKPDITQLDLMAKLALDLNAIISKAKEDCERTVKLAEQEMDKS